jgi:hypothetical protein
MPAMLIMVTSDGIVRSDNGGEMHRACVEEHVVEEMAIEPRLLHVLRETATAKPFSGRLRACSLSSDHGMPRQGVHLPADQQTFYSHWHRSLSEDEIVATDAEAYLP